MWIYTDSLSCDEKSGVRASEWLKSKSPSESLCVAVMRKEEKKMGGGGVG